MTTAHKMVWELLSWLALGSTLAVVVLALVDGRASTITEAAASAVAAALTALVWKPGKTEEA